MTENDELREEVDDQGLDQQAGGSALPIPITPPVTVLGPCGPVLTVIPEDPA